MSTECSIVAEVERLGFKYKIVAEYDLSQLSPERRVQVRETTHYAPRDAVQRYAEQMKQNRFPPPVVTKDRWIIDGNTRISARQQRRERFCRVIVLDESYESAMLKRKSEMHALAATLNGMNGNSLTTREQRAEVRRQMELGWKTEEIGRRLGASQSFIAQVRKEVAAETRLKTVGAVVKLSDKQLRALGTKDILCLNDMPYRRLAELAELAALNAHEIRDLGATVLKAGSDERALALLTNAQNEWDTRIRDVKLTGVARSSLPMQLRQHLGFLLKQEGNESEFIEYDPRFIARHVDKLRRAETLIQKLLEQQPKQRVSAA